MSIPILHRRILIPLILILGYSPQLWGLNLEVRVEGVAGELESNVLSYLQIYQEREDPKLLPSRVRYLHGEAETQIGQALQPFGYFRPVVTGNLKEQKDGQESSWSASYVIDPGEPIRVAGVDYRLTGEGASDTAFPKVLPLAQGDVLDQRLYEKGKAELLQRAAANGYLKSRLLASEIRIDLEAYEANVIVHFDTGPRYFMGKVSFDQDVLDPDFLQRYIKFEEGEPYDVNKVLRLQGNLYSSEYFKQVEITPLMDKSEDRRVPLRVAATPSPLNKYRIGVGFATDFGPRVTLDWNRRRIGRRGHKAFAQLLVSPGLKELSGEYRIPLERPSSDYFSINPAFIDYDTESRKGQVIRVNFEHSVIKGSWRRNLGLDFRYEDYEVSEDDDSVQEIVPNISWSRTITDQVIYTRHGKREKLSLLGAVEGLVSSATYLQGHLSGKWIRSFGEDYRFLYRGELGATFADDVLDLAASRRFFAGGDNSIRGYGLDELGPQNALGEAVGGRYLAIGSLELERRVKGKWSVALFVDGGNAYDPDYDNSLEFGAGIGVRWLSPLGQIRVDLASAVSQDGSPFRLHIVIGPDL